LLNKRCLVLNIDFHNKVNLLNDVINVFSISICLVEHAI
jgi:hypothetical protein